MDQGVRLKSGNTCTVQKMNLHGRDLVVKRYNPKPFLYRLMRRFSTSRATRSWANAHTLREAGIPTALPIGVIEENRNGLLYRAYYIMEYIEGKDLDAFFSPEKHTPDGTAFVVNTISDLFEALRSNFLVHGDTKATNFILADDGVVHVIDVDSLKIHPPSRSFRRCFEKDRARFLSNWEERPEIKDTLDKALPRA